MATQSNPPLRIAFGCNKGVGKSLAAGYLQAKYGGVIINFADPVYEIMWALQVQQGLPRHKDRATLRTIATALRKIDPDVWVNIFKTKVAQLVKDREKEGLLPPSIFVADVRFPNEHAALKELGFITVNITRKEADDLSDKHESETSMASFNGWDLNIINDGYNLSNFHASLKVLVEMHLRWNWFSTSHT